MLAQARRLDERRSRSSERASRKHRDAVEEGDEAVCECSGRRGVHDCMGGDDCQLNFPKSAGSSEASVLVAVSHPATTR